MLPFLAASCLWSFTLQLKDLLTVDFRSSQRCAAGLSSLPAVFPSETYPEYHIHSSIHLQRVRVAVAVSASGLQTITTSAPSLAAGAFRLQRIHDNDRSALCACACLDLCVGLALVTYSSLWVVGMPATPPPTSFGGVDSAATPANLFHQPKVVLSPPLPPLYLSRCRLVRGRQRPFNS